MSAPAPSPPAHQRYQAPPDALAGRVIAVTGAGDGIGRAVALAAAAHGAELVLIGRSVAKLEAVHAKIAALKRAEASIAPLDLERENPNLIGGDSLSGSHHLDQNFFLRPVAGWSRYRTPVKGLYLCGASTWPGAGTGAGSGFMLAKMLAG